LDAYFATSPQGAKERGFIEIEEDIHGDSDNEDEAEGENEKERNSTVEQEATYSKPDYSMDVDDVTPPNDDYGMDYSGDSDDKNQQQLEDDNEVSFKSTVKVVRSPQTTTSSEGTFTRPRRSLRGQASQDQNQEQNRNPNEQEQEQNTPTVPKTKRKLGRKSHKDQPLVDVKAHLNDMGRASKRQRMAPLAFWRNEKVVYGRRQSSRMPVIVDVLRANEESSPTKQIKRKSSRSAAQKVTTSLKDAGYRARVSATAKVMDYDTHRETERCTPSLCNVDDSFIVLALGPDQVQTKTVKGEDFAIQTVFTEGTFLSSGILEFPPGSSKPTRNSSKHALVSPKSRSNCRCSLLWRVVWR
jgi:hypothetical protein